MKKLLALGFMVLALVLFFGCISPTGEDMVTDGSLYQRPEFIDTRPDEVKAQFTITANPGFVLEEGVADTVRAGDPNPNPAHKYAYIVGISDYEGTSNDLQYCDDDARDWQSYLQSQGFTIRMDLDRNATADNIIAGLTWLKNSAVPGDEIIFAYSGHGNNPKTYGSCLISTDLYYVTYTTVAQYIQGANCTKKFVAVDACKAIDFLKVGGTNSVSSTASTTTYSYDGTASMANGVWTYYFMEAVNSLGYVYAEDASNYAKTKMTAWAKTAHVRVSPSMTDNYTGSFDM